MFSLKRNPDKLQFSDDLQIVPSESIKILGITVDMHLQWNQHIQTLCGKLKSSCFGLKFMSNHCSTEILLTLYYANFHSSLKYGIINWGNSSQVSRVFLLQKYAVRIIAELNSLDTCRYAFKNLKIMTLVSIYILEICTYVFKNKSMFLNNQTSHGYETRHKEQLQTASFRTTMYQKSFIYNGCKCFNYLADEIKSSPNIKIFRAKLKHLLVRKVCYTLDEFFV